MTSTRIVPASFVALTFVLGVHSARAETTNCTAITSVPFIISAPGVYCLTGSLITSMASGKAISIGMC